MKQETKHNLKQSVETLLIAIICSACVMSLNRSCANKVTHKDTAKQKMEILQDNVISNIKQNVR